MKKLFISVPMKDRTVEDIRKSMDKMHRIAEAITGEQLAVIDTWIDDEPPEGTVTAGVWYLGESITMLSYADYFIGVKESWHWDGCACERMIADRYHIKMIEVDTVYVAQDAWESVVKEEIGLK